MCDRLCKIGLISWLPECYWFFGKDGKFHADKLLVYPK